jgi:hypothetical protein
MAKLNTYYTVPPTLDDILFGTDNTIPSRTRNFTVAGLFALYNTTYNVIPPTLQIVTTNGAITTNTVYLNGGALSDSINEQSSFSPGQISTVNINTGAGSSIDSAGMLSLSADGIGVGTIGTQYVTNIVDLQFPNKPAGSYTLATTSDIPAAQVNSDWDATSGVAEILNKPTIPAAVTKTSDLTNDGENGVDPFITAADIPPITGFVPYTGATQDVDLGEFEIKAGQIEFDQTPTGTAGVGIMQWNDSDGTVDLGLKGGNVTLQVGQEQVLRVVNKTATNIDLLEANYQAVRVTGAQGQRLKVDLAQAINDTLSAETIGLVTETINNNQEGFITTSGLVRGINTTGSLQGETWANGDILYLSPTTAGNATKVKPVAPNHLIILGYVTRAHINQGSIFVKVDNGYELDELHNVKITSAANNNVLAYTSATDIWENKTVETALGYTPFQLPALTSGSVLFSNGTTIAQDNANLFWDDTNNRLGIGTTAPSYKLQIAGTEAVSAVRSNAGYDIYPVPAPTSLSGVVSAGGSVDTGVHGYYLTYKTAIGETDPKGPISITTTAGNNTVTLTLPISTDERVIARKIYRTKVGSIYNEYLLVTINDNTTTTYVDTADDSTLTAEYRNSYYRANTTTNYITVRGVKAMTADPKATYFGFNAGSSITSAGYNAFFGSDAGRFTTTGFSNTFIGYQSGYSNTTGGGSVIIGSQAAYNTTSAADSVVIGSLAGRYYNGGASNIATTSNSVFLGMRSYAATATPNNAIVIGFQAESIGNNTVVLGNNSIVTTALKGNVLINTTTDGGYRLDVNGTARVSGDFSLVLGNAIRFGTALGLSKTTNKMLIYGGTGSGNAGGTDIHYWNGSTYVAGLRLNNNANVLINTTTDVASSKLTIESTTQGFLPPRMTTTQKNAIATPAAGLVVYDTDLNQLCTYDGTWGDSPFYQQSLRGVRFFTDFDSSISYDNFVSKTSGVAAATSRLTNFVPNQTANQIGIAHYQTGTAVTGYAMHITENSANAMQFQFGGGTWMYESYIEVDTLSDATDRFRFISGFGNVATSGVETNGAFFTYDEGGVSNGTIASPNWQCVTVNNVVRTLTTTSVAVTTTWTKLRIIINADATEVKFYIDGTLVATHTTNIPTFALGRRFKVKQMIAKSLGTGNRFVYCDYIFYENNLTTLR